MLTEFLALTAAGLICTILGVLIWKKEKISLIHAYHHAKVKQADKKAYTTMMGKAVTLLGVSCIACGAVNYFMKTSGGWVIFAVALLYCFVSMAKAQKMYNGSMM